MMKKKIWTVNKHHSFAKFDFFSLKETKSTHVETSNRLTTKERLNKLRYIYFLTVTIPFFDRLNDPAKKSLEKNQVFVSETKESKIIERKRD